MRTHARYQTAVYAGLSGVWTVSVAAVVVSEGLEFALGSLSLDYSLQRLPEFTEPSESPEFALP